MNNIPSFTHKVELGILFKNMPKGFQGFQKGQKAWNIGLHIALKPRRGRIFNCPVCNKEFYLKPYSANHDKIHCCSHKCQFSYQIKGKLLNCKFCGKEYYRPPSQIKWRGSSFCSKICQGKYISKYLIGKNSPCWRDGKSSIYKRLRSSKKFRIWREKVFKRDNWTCQKCGIRSGIGIAVKLHPHHIKGFTKFPKLRFSVKNGQTLCELCHKEIHKKKQK